MASVKLDKVKKIYDGNVVAVQEFNLDIKDKEFVVFVVCAVINLVVYNFIPSVKNEEDFQ